MTGSDLLNNLPEESLVKFNRFLKTQDKDTLNALMEDEAFASRLKDYTDFRNKGVSVGSLCKTAQFWLS